MTVRFHSLKSVRAIGLATAWFAAAAMLAGATTAAAQTTDQPSTAGAGGVSGVGQYPPQTWGVAATTVNNPTDRETELLVTISFEDQPTLSFSRRVWLPPRSQRRVWIPLRTGEFDIDPQATHQLNITQQLIDDSGEQPLVLDTETGTLIAARDRFITGMLADGDSDQGNVDDDALHAALAMRRVFDLSNRLAYLRVGELPTMPAGWDGLNALVVSMDSPDLDAAQIAALRSWLLSGGRLWIMLDQVDPAFARRLLGDAWTCDVVDDVDLTDVRVAAPGEARASTNALTTVTLTDALSIELDGETVGSLAGNARSRNAALEKLARELDTRFRDRGLRSEKQVELRISGAASGQQAHDLIAAVRTAANVAAVERGYEQPVRMTRVLATDMEVLHEVNGWPASLRKAVGQGELLVTTVGPRVWYEPVLVPQRGPGGQVAKDADGNTRYTHGQAASRPLEELAVWFQAARPQPPMPAEAFDDYLNEQVGYEIVGRGTITLLLGLFCALVAGAALWLAAKRGVEWLAPIAMGVAVVVTVALLIVGFMNRTSVPFTVADAQLVQVDPEQQHAIITGRLNIYNPGAGSDTAVDIDDDNAPLGARAGGLILPTDLDLLRTRNVRMEWTDLDRWRWVNVDLPSGERRRATYRQVRPLGEAVRAAISFDERGVVGRVQPGPFESFEHIVVATPNGHLVAVDVLTHDGAAGGADSPSRVNANAGDASGASNDGELPAPALTFHAEVRSRGQYLAGSSVDAAEQRVQALYRTLLGDATANVDEDPTSKAFGDDANGRATRGGDDTSGNATTRRANYPDAPTLIAWAPRLPTGFALPATEHHKGAAIVAIPLRINRPSAGAAITVPPAFLPFELVRRRGEPSLPPPYDRHRRVWLPMSLTGVARFRFTPPAELRPLRVTDAALTLDITAAGWTVDVLATDAAGELVKLESFNSPTAPLTVTVPADRAQLNADGGIDLALRVNRGEGTEPTMWRIRDMRLEVRGVVE